MLAALHEPEVLLLDEPFDGVDPIGVEATFDVIADARARGACVLVSTHLRELAVQACEHGARAARRLAGRDRRAPTRWPARRAPVPTALSSTDEPSPRPAGRADVGHLLRFRAARGPPARRASRWARGDRARAHRWPRATVPGVPRRRRARDAAARRAASLLPTAFAGVPVLSVVSAVASGGGRELLAREQGVAFPVSPTTDHLGALLLAPLNIAWLLQAWALLGVDGVRAAAPDAAAGGAASSSCSGSSPRPPSRRWWPGRWRRSAAGRTASLIVRAASAPPRPGRRAGSTSPA